MSIASKLIAEVEARIEAKMIQAMSENDKLDIVTVFDEDRCELTSQTFWDGKLIKTTALDLTDLVDAIVKRVLSQL